MPRGIKRLIVTEIWISEPLRGRGLGKRLMDRAKAIAARQKRRAIISKGHCLPSFDDHRGERRYRGKAGIRPCEKKLKNY